MGSIAIRTTQNTKGLLIRQPWIDKILAGSKTWEIRGSNTAIRGAIALIESGTGTVVGVCEIEAVEGPLTVTRLRRSRAKHGAPISRFKDGLPYPKTYAWVLKGARTLAKPVPYQHPRGAVIWVKLQPSVQRAIRRMIGQ
jgi:hypothetical protein